jgi:fatty acid desaturase
LRKFAAQTRRRLLFAGLVLILLIGSVLIALTYGTPAAGCAIASFIIALIPVGAIVLFLWFLQWIVRRGENDDSNPQDAAHDRS